MYTTASGRPAWSPDGTQILFNTNRDDGDFEVYVMNTDGTDPLRLTHQAGNDVGPMWSPDGNRIAFFSYGLRNESDIYVMNADGSDPIRVTSMAGDEFVPDWSPDGSRILFETENGLHLINVDGTNLVRLSTSESRFEDLMSSWSADGRIAFTSTRRSTFRDIFVMDEDGSNVVNFTNSPTTNEQWPEWWTP
jgi:TolB protein